MTRRMACTQSSISRWELAMSRSASGLAGTFSRSPAPPARQTDKVYYRVPVQGRRSPPDTCELSSCFQLVPSPFPHLTWESFLVFLFFSLALTLVCLCLFICLHIKTEIIRSLTRHYWGEMPVSGQLRELQSLRRLHCALCEVSHCV